MSIEKSGSLLSVQHLDKYFGNQQILKDINFDVHPNEVVSLIGPSGAGKSTLLRCLNFLEHPTKGKIQFAGAHIDAEKVKASDIAFMRKNTGMVFQSFNSFQEKTALENIMFGLLKVQHKSQEEADAIGRTLLQKVGLSGKENSFPRQLSGGQQQRVAIARAVALNPKIILFDEPTSALDPEMVQKVLEVIHNLAQEGQTMIIVSHEMNFVRRISDRVIFMADGVIEETGTPQEIFDDPQQIRTQNFIDMIIKH